MPRRRSIDDAPKKASRRAVYDGALARIRSALQLGAFEPGSLLPPERELAERYGISRKTARKVLNTLAEDGVVERCPRVGYRVNHVPAVPLKAKTTTVALIHRDFGYLAVSHRFFSVLESLLADAGHQLLFGASGREAERENAWIRQFRSSGVGALVVAPARRGESSSELEAWIRDRLPVVLYGHPKPWRLPLEVTAQCDQVDMDNRGGVEQAVRYLISLGHRDIAFLCAQPLADTQRYEPFMETTRAAGISTGPGRVLGDLPEGEAGAQQALSRFREQASFPTAVFCASDALARGLMEVLAREGLRCPEDISIIGFGDRSSVKEESSRLSSVDFNSDTAAVETVRLLRKQFAGDLDHPERVEIPVRLVIRESACPPARG